MKVRVFGRNGLAEDNGSVGAQSGHRECILTRRAAGPHGRAELGRHVVRIEDVLDADRHAVQRTKRLALHAMQIGCLSLPHREIAVEKCPGLDVRIDLVDPREAIVHQLGRLDAAVAYVRRCFGQRQCGQNSCATIHVSAACTR